MVFSVMALWFEWIRSNLRHMGIKWLITVCERCCLAADPSSKQSYSCITDEHSSRVSYSVHQDESPVRNNDGDETRRSSVCMLHAFSVLLLFDVDIVSFIILIDGSVLVSSIVSYGGVMSYFPGSCGSNWQI